MRGWFLGVAVILTLATGATAQAPGRFAWKQGQILMYRVEQTTTVTEVVDGSKSATTSKNSNLKCWRVLDVDANGVATLQLWIASLRVERTKPDGEVLLFDSTDPEKSNPQVREQLTKFVNQTLAVLRVDARGKVVEVKDVKQGPPSRFESDPPFVLVLPEAALQAGQGWERDYSITLEPPVGVGEKFPTVQKYVCKGIENGLATVGLTTTIKAPPAAAADQEPLLEKQTEGEIVFDTQNGCLRSARLTVDKEIKGHDGEGSSYRIQSTYTEQHAGTK